MRWLRPAAALRPARARQRRLIPVLAVLLLVLAYLLWPYVTLSRLDRALVRNDQAALADLVDLDAIRDEIRRKLNKDANGTIGPFSDGFIAWLEQGIRTDGTAALEEQVNLAWVRERLLANAPPGDGLGPVLGRVLFEDPGHFTLRLGAATATPVFLRLGFTGLGWRVQALYY
jgi:hypothetical protein